MDNKIFDCRTGNISDNHILPFFWQHGEDHHLLAEEMDAIQACGIQEICVESRPHPQFCQDPWWDDFGFILEEARRRSMRVWLLDDQKFPTGYAAGYIHTHPELRMTSLRIVYTDFIGPQRETALIATPLKEDERYVGIIAYRREQKGIVLAGEGVDLLPLCRDGLIWWDIPEGAWRVYYIIRTHDTCMPYKEAYIDMLSPESCAAMIHAVYQPHYDHFAEYFGNTFVGFFSDEPSFSNDVETYWSILGKEGMLIPWHDALIGEMADYTGLSQGQIYLLLPGLLHDINGKTKLIREAYMEVITRRYSRNFSWQLGNWCRDHGVSYIGHIIEDMNTHQRLGFGTGHFFRSMEGQDMAGIDIVLNQIIPGFTDFDHTNNACERTIDCDFYQYTLAKLGSSQAHLEPLKKNRAMCELFGAFGWAEGVPMMKYLTDQMLVSGINHFVPHAFTPLYPDPDCPPHFYARGKNHQFPVFTELMGYMKRMCHVLSEGTHQASVAVYYNAEAEWAAGKCMMQQDVCKVLTRKQIDFDLVPKDILCRDAQVLDHQLHIHRENYQALIIPYSQYLPVKFLKHLESLAADGLPILFVDGLPDGDVDGNHLCDTLAHCEVLPLEQLADVLAQRGLQGIVPDIDVPHLRFYHLHKEDHDIIMVWNESIFEEIDTMLTLPVKGHAAFYDGWGNQYYQPQQDEQTVRLHLTP